MKLGFRLRKLYWRLFRPITLGCRVIVVRENRVLLVHHTYVKGWSLPGGGVDRGETFAQAAVRELREECGVEIETPRLVSLHLKTRDGNFDHIAVFATDQSRGQPHPAATHEISETRFFAFDDLPKDLWKGHRRRLEEFRAGLTPSPEW